MIILKRGNIQLLYCNALFQEWHEKIDQKHLTSSQNNQDISKSADYIGE